MFLVILLYMILASTFTLGKAVLAYLQPLFFIGVRMVCGGLLLLGYQYFSNKGKFFVSKRHLFLFAQIVFFHIFLAYTAEFWALKYLSSSKTALIYNISPFVTAIFAYLLFSQKLTMKKLGGLCIGFFGFLIVLINGASSEEIIQGGIWFFSWPEIVLTIAVISAAYGWIVFKKLMEEGYSPITINGFGMLVGGISALFLSFIVEGYPAINTGSTSLSHAISMSILYGSLLIIIANLIFYNFYGFLLKQYTVTFLSFAGFLCPLFAAFFGNIFLGEWPSIYFFIAMFLVSVGLYLFYQEELQQGYMKN